MTKRIARRRAQIGLTVGGYETILAAQGGGCAICGNPPKTRRLDCDHAHKTGEVRGLLCHSCNRKLWPGVTSKWLCSALTYLEGGALGRGAVDHFNAQQRERSI